MDKCDSMRRSWQGLKVRRKTVAEQKTEVIGPWKRGNRKRTPLPLSRALVYDHQHSRDGRCLGCFPMKANAREAPTFSHEGRINVLTVLTPRCSLATTPNLGNI
jgi:hypothetical protein